MIYYDQIARGYDKLHGAEQSAKLAIIKERLIPRMKDRLLDVGCGTGISSEFSCFVVGLDPSFKLLKRSKALRVCGVAEHLPFRDKAFDFVVSVTAVHNFSDVRAGLLEIDRVGTCQFAISVLAKSRKRKSVEILVEKIFSQKLKVSERHDIIFFCAKRFI
ncbi:MAG: class I SAM-dependent methyltransferase [Candidatus Woesearchaeota archaeon]